MISRILDYKIIDIHTHMGQQYCLYYPEHDMDSMCAFMEEAGVEFVICCPLEDVFSYNTKRFQIKNAMKKYPEKFKGYYGINPSCYNIGLVKRDFEENPGYVGIGELLPDYHRVDITDELYRPIMEFADENNLILLCHTWGTSIYGESRNSADKIARILDTYQNIIFIMGHSIQGQADLAINLAKSFNNAYLDMNDTGRLNGMIEKMVREAGAHKILFGSDAPMQTYYNHMGAVLGARITDVEKKMIFRDNALNIFSRSERTSQHIKHLDF